jgi:hypothetical protein
MSKNIEDLFKQSLENYEESYDPSAWDALQSKLDSKQEPNKNSKNTSNWKTFTLITATIGVASYFMFTNKNDSKKIEQKNTQPKTVIKENTTYPISNQEKTNAEEIKAPNKTIIIKPNSTILPQNEVEKTIEFKIEDNKNGQNETKRTLLVTSRSIYCQGEIETFKNENEHTIYLIHESGKNYSLRKDEKKPIELNDIGTYYWSFENTLNTDNKLKGFEVINSPKINFFTPQDADLSTGLPIVSLTSNQNGNNKWYINGKPYAQGKEIDLYAFNKGKYEIKLINESNGCKSELTKSFDSDENYNLMSVTGIDPNHSDPKRNSFIPYALFLRKTEFRMLIISPTTGETIFETTELDKPWRGKNEKTDELVPENSEFIWKVILTNPVKGEKTEYKGRITRI